jgi:hypothetical protein
MPSIDVRVTKKGNLIGIAQGRPLRVTPNLSPGVMYRSRVYEVHLSPDTTYVIDLSAKSWSSEGSGCKVASFQESQNLIRQLQAARGDADNATALASANLNVPLQDASTKPKDRTTRDPANENAHLNELLELLRPHLQPGTVE